MKPKQPITDALRKAIAESGLAQIELERQTGVQRMSIVRFMRGECSLRLDLAERLFTFFGLEVRSSKRKVKVSNGK